MLIFFLVVVMKICPYYGHFSRIYFSLVPISQIRSVLRYETGGGFALFSEEADQIAICLGFLGPDPTKVS